jgi:hypothetical protein
MITEILEKSQEPRDESLASSATIQSLKQKWRGIAKFGKPIETKSKGIFLLPFKCPLDP